MKLNRKLIRALEALIAAFLVWAVVGVLLHSKRIDSFSVTLNPDGVEHRDKVMLGVGKADEAPDYNLWIRVSDEWRDLGTFANTYIGDGIAFSVGEVIPSRRAREARLLDQDNLESDALEQGPLAMGLYSGVNYTIEANESFDLEAGFDWFFATAVGIAILTGITIAVAVVVLGSLAYAGHPPRSQAPRGACRALAFVVTSLAISTAHAKPFPELRAVRGVTKVEYHKPFLLVVIKNTGRIQEIDATLEPLIAERADPDLAKIDGPIHL